MPPVRPSVRPSVDRPPSSPLPLLPLAAMPANGVGGICSLLVSPREVRELGEIYSTGGDWGKREGKKAQDVFLGKRWTPEEAVYFYHSTVAR